MVLNCYSFCWNFWVHYWANFCI